MSNPSVLRFERLIESNDVAKFMAEEEGYNNDPSQVVADAMHYCEHLSIDYQKNEDTARILREHRTYTTPVHVLSDLIRWCESNHYDWKDVVEKAEFYVLFDKGEINFFDCMMA